MKNFTLLFFLVLFFSCKSDPNNKTDTNVPGESASTAPAPAAAQPAANTSQPPQKLDAVLTLAASSPAIRAGQVGCVSVTCVGFVDLVSMQYTMVWDKNVLQFNGVKGFNLPYLGNSNFGAHRSAEGELTFVWIDESLKGVTKDDGTAVFEVCFTATGATGEATAFQFTDKPTLIEAVHKSVREVNFKGLQGVVKVQ